MSQAPQQPELPEETVPSEAAPPQGLSWSQVWQLPLLIVGVLLLGVSLYLSLPTQEQHDFDGALREVQLYLKAGNTEQAKAQLEHVQANLELASPAQAALHWLLWGDAVYLEQRSRGVDLAQNHERVRQYYATAQQKGLTLDAEHLQRLAETLVALNQEQAALMLLEQLKDEPAERRYRILRQIIERRLALPSAPVAPLTSLVSRYLDELRGETNLATRRSGRIWAQGLLADAALEQGDPVAAISGLAREMVKFADEGGEKDLTPLMIRMGKAYSLTGEYPKARRQFELARARMDSTDPLQAHALVGLAEIELAESQNVAQAQTLFTEATHRYPDLDFRSRNHDAYLAALIGRADCEARLRNYGEAVASFTEAATLLKDNPHAPKARLEQLLAAVLAQHGIAYDTRQFLHALDYLNVLLPLFGKSPPADVLIKLADTHQQIALQHLADADNPNREEDRKTPLTHEQRTHNQRAAIHFEQAGDHYLAHAQAVTMDDSLYSQSLWKAAEAFDRAQLWKRSIEVWDLFVRTRGEDPRLLEAINRLGQSYLADGQEGNAATQFERLVENFGRTPEAYSSLVPLAKSYAALGRDDAALRVLLSVVNDHPAITPADRSYRDALIELGRLYYGRGEYVPAIERLSEAVERYGSTAEGALLRYRLADSYLLSTPELDRQIAEPGPPSRAAALRGERASRLERAHGLFSQVITDLEQRDSRDLSDLEKVCLRNAFFYRADCLYDLGQFERAITFYDQAAKRWEHHPASLVALIQIVNAYSSLGKAQEARVANARASDHLRRIPEEAFNDRTLPLTRQHWEDWLRWTSELNLFADSPPPAAVGSSRVN